MSCSANALETVLYSHEPTNNSEWVKWELEDTGRAELPLEGSEDTYAAGMSLDLTSQEEVHVSETLTLPPSPLLLLYSDHGVLCPFTMINKTALASALKVLVSPPKPLPSDPRLVRQQKPSGQPSPPRSHPPRPASASATVSTATAMPTLATVGAASPQLPPGQPLAASGLNLAGQQRPPFLQPASTLGQPRPVAQAPPIRQTPPLGQATPLGQAPPIRQAMPLGQAPPIRQAMALGQSSPLGQAPLFGQAPSIRPAMPLGQAPPIRQAMPLGQAPPIRQAQPLGQALSQPRPPAGVSPFNVSGLASSGQPPSSFPFSVSSLAASSLSSRPPPPPSSSSSAVITSSPQQQLQTLPPQLSSSQLPMATSLPGQRLPPGYPSQQQQQRQSPLSPPSSSIDVPPSAQVTSVRPGTAGSLAPTMTGLTPTMSTPVGGSPRYLGITNPLTLQQPSVSAVAASGPQMNQSISAQPGQLPVRPLHSSTPLAHTAVGLLPQQPGPRPSYPAPPPTAQLRAAVAVGIASHLPPPQSTPLGGTGPPPVRMTAPQPLGSTPPAQGQPLSVSGQPPSSLPSYLGRSPQAVQRQAPIPTGPHPHPGGGAGGGREVSFKYKCTMYMHSGPPLFTLNALFFGS